MIIDIIRKDLPPPTIGDIAINTLALMEEYKVRDIPIVDYNNKFIGVARESDIMNMENLQGSLSFIENKLKSVFIFSDAHIFHSIEILSENKLSLIPVIDKNQSYLGYLHPIDVLNKIRLINHNHSNTSIIIISLNKKDYTFYEISRLIEENNGKIISLWTQIKEEKIDVHLLINCINTKIIVQTLERYDYHVNEIFDHNVKYDNLNDRFESFIKYLNT